MNNKTKIFYLITSSVMGGAEKQLYELTTNLNKDKFEILVCTIKGEKDGSLLENLRKQGIKTKSLDINAKWQFYKLTKLYFVIRKFKPDILQSFLYFDNIVARFFGKITGIPIIISGQRNAETRRSWLRNFLDKITLPFTDLIVSNSEAGKKILIDREKVSKEKIKVIHNGIDLKVFKNQEHKSLKDELTIGFVGHLTKQKGVKYLLRAIKDLKEKRDDFVLKIIGNGPERINLEKLTKELGLVDKVKFLGHKENAWKYMSGFDLLVLPSLWEGLPNVIMEVIACRVPVVATNIGGVPEIIKDGETGFLVEPKNSEALAEKIEYVLNLSEEEREKIGESARRTVKEKFSIEKMVREYEGLYGDLIN